MTIGFSETFNKVRECFQEQSIIDLLLPKLASITIIRDVKYLDENNYTNK